MFLDTGSQINIDRKKILSQNVLLGVKGVVFGVKKLVGDIYEQNGIISQNNYLKDERNLTGEKLEEILGKMDSGVEITKKERLLLIQKIERNNPIYGILTNLNRGDNFGSIIFKGVKELNDTVSQAFTDKVLDEFKTEIKKGHTGIKVVWDNYKNFVFKIPRNSKIDQKALEKMMKDILAKNIALLNVEEKSKGEKEKYSEKHITDIIKVASTTSIISGRTQEDFMHNIAYARLSLERQGVKGLLSKEEIVVKEKELFNKYFHSTSKVHRKYLQDDGVYFVENNNLVRKFMLNGREKTEKTVIFYPNGNINIDFITKVRKKQLPTNCSCYNDFKILFESYVARAEFIAPYIKRDDLEKGEILTTKELEDYKKVISQIEQNKIKSPKKIRQLSENNYKNSLEKGVFYNKIKQKGQLFYVDIKDMGSINMKDFSDKINLWNAGLITAKEILLKSGDNMTIKFQNIIKELKEKLGEIYPENKVNISIGGDEIMVFVEGIENNLKAKEIIESLFEILKSNQVEGRVTERLIKEENLPVGGEQLVEALDKLTKKTKEIEKRLEIIKQNLFLARKGISNSEENIVMNKRISDFEKLRNFSLSIENNVEYITFHNRPKGLEDKILLSNVIDSKGNLKGNPPSPFVKYLDDHQLGRKKNRHPKQSET